MELAVFSCGYSMAPQRLMTKGAPWARALMPLLAFAIKTPDHGVILIDAPFGVEGISVMSAAQRFAFGTLGGMKVDPGQGLKDNLDKLGWGMPSRGVFTHLHFDHVAGLNDVPDLPWTVSTKNWDHAQSMTAYYATRHGYMEASWWKGRDVTSVDVSGSMTEGHDLLGDGTIELINLAGHTPGHTGVMVQLGARRVFLCGDAAYEASQITRGHELATFPRASAENLPQMLETLKTLREFSRTNPDIEILTSHDFVMGQRTKEGPVILREEVSA